MPAPAPVEKAPPKASPVTRRRKPSAAAPSGSIAASTTTRKAPRRRTSQADFKPWIVSLLQEAGGEQEADTLLGDLETRLGDRLMAGDHETGPTGEKRWRTAARWARKSLADDGLLVAPQPGTWALTPRGLAEPSIPLGSID